MTVGNQNKIELIEALERTKSKAHRLALTLRFRGRDADARKVEARARKLTRQIDRLLASAMDRWLGNATTHKKRLATTNARLQRAIREIQKNKDVARNVGGALSLLDVAIQTALDLFPV